jgi:hypothetical protein
MIEFHKIHTIFKRDKVTNKIILDEYSLDEFYYLKDNQWEWSEKVDGTNCRILWDHLQRKLTFGGRTDSSQMPIQLITKLQEIFTVEKMMTFFPDISVIFFGEGYGSKIQEPSGSLYKADGVDFILFDVKIGKWWLERDSVNKIASNFEIKSVPIITSGTIKNAVALVSSGFKSHFGNFTAEGIVLRPETELYSRSGNRIIAKLKCKDFNWDDLNDRK